MVQKTDILAFKAGQSCKNGRQNLKDRIAVDQNIGSNRLKLKKMIM